MQVSRPLKRRRVDPKKKWGLSKADLKLTLAKWGHQIHQHNFKVSSAFVVTYNGAANFTGQAWSFKLSDYTGTAALQSVYDRYRLCWVKAEFFPRQNSVSAADQTTTYTGSPSLMSVIDKDDDNAPTAYTDLVQYDSARAHPFDKPFRRTFKPFAALAAYSGTFTSYASSATNTWFDIASPDVRFYGLKVGTFPYSLANNADAPAWDVIFTYYMEFLHTR